MDRSTQPGAVVQRAVRCLSDGWALEAVYLFGSAAARRLIADRHVDPAVLADEPPTARRRLDLIAALAHIVRRDVDLVDLRRTSTGPQPQMAAHGQRLLVQDASAVAWFKMRALKSYALLNEERAPILERMRREGAPRWPTTSC